MRFLILEENMRFLILEENMRVDNGDTRIGNVTIHRGTRYGGVNQKGEGASGGSSLAVHNDKFATLSTQVPGAPRPHRKIIKKKDCVEDIMWETAGEGQYLILNCEYAIKILGMELGKSTEIHRELYDIFVKTMKSLSTESDFRTAHFNFLGQGWVENNKRIGIFIKLEKDGIVVVLPKLFFGLCSQAIVKGFIIDPPRDHRHLRQKKLVQATRI